MRQILTAFLLAFSLVASGLSARADDTVEFRRIIEAQIAAFQAEDGQAAYQYASPNIQSIFPNPEMFMGMVEKGYPQIWRPKSVRFGGVGDELGGPTQKVLIIDQAGKLWSVFYLMQRQPDTSWKINGVRVMEAAGEA